MKKLFLSFILLLCLSTTTTASDMYLTGQLAWAEVDVDSEFISTDANSLSGDVSGINIALGIRPYQNLGFELGYYKIGLLEDMLEEVLGFFEFENISLSGNYLAMVASLDVSDNSFLFGKLGVMDWEATVDPGYPDEDSSDTGVNTIYAVGFGSKISKNVELSVTHLVVDIEHFDIGITSFGINWIF